MHGLSVVAFGRCEPVECGPLEAPVHHAIVDILELDHRFIDVGIWGLLVSQVLLNLQKAWDLGLFFPESRSRPCVEYLQKVVQIFSLLLLLIGTFLVQSRRLVIEGCCDLFNARQQRDISFFEDE